MVRSRRWRIGYGIWWLLGRVHGLRWSRFGLWWLGVGNRLVVYEVEEDGRWRRI
jgi:hypothetical protein